MKTQMEHRIRFGSDGNGIFIAVSVHEGPGSRRTWRISDDERTFLHHAMLANLPTTETLAGKLYFRDEWNPGQPFPSTNPSFARDSKAV